MLHTRPGWEAKTTLEIVVPVNLFRASFMTPKLTVVEVGVVDMMNHDVVVVTENIMSAQNSHVFGNYTI